jgi:hypothetical protein
MKLNNLFDTLTRLRYPWPVKLLVTAAVILLVNKSLSKEQLPSLLKGISIVPFSIVFLLGCLGFYCQVKRWQFIVRLYGVTVSGVDALRTMLWGCLLAFLTPGRTGEFFRGFSLPDLKKDDGVVAVLVEKLFAGGTTIFFGIVCCGLFLASNGTPWWGNAVIVGGSVAALAAAGGIFTLRKTGLVKRPLDRLPALSFSQAGILACYSVLAHGFLLAQTAALLAMFGSDAVFGNALAGGQAYGVMLFFPFFIANMGIREYSFGMFLGHGHTTLCAAGLSAAAFGASMGILIVNIILPAIIGLGWWIVEKNRIVTGYQLPVTSKRK